MQFSILSEKGYTRLVNELFELEHIRYAVVLDDFGEKLLGGMKPGVKTSTPTDAEKRLEIQSILILRMAEQYEQFDGKLHYTCIKWDKLSALFFFLSSNRTLAVTVQPSAPPDFGEEVEKLVQRFRK